MSLVSHQLIHQRLRDAEVQVGVTYDDVTLAIVDYWTRTARGAKVMVKFFEEAVRDEKELTLRADDSEALTDKSWAMRRIDWVPRGHPDFGVLFFPYTMQVIYRGSSRA